MIPHRLPPKGPLVAYIEDLVRLGLNKEAKRAARAVRLCLSTPDGRILLDLLEKATIQAPTEILADPRALAARNAQSFIAHDLRRIMSDETDAILDDKTGAKRGN